MDPSKFLGASPLQTSLATLATLLLLAPRLVYGFNCIESPLPNTVGDPSGWGWAPPLRESGMKTSNRELGPAIIIVLLPTVLPHGNPSSWQDTYVRLKPSGSSCCHRCRPRSPLLSYPCWE